MKGGMKKREGGKRDTPRPLLSRLKAALCTHEATGNTWHQGYPRNTYWHNLIYWRTRIIRDRQRDTRVVRDAPKTCLQPAELGIWTCLDNPLHTHGNFDLAHLACTFAAV